MSEEYTHSDHQAIIFQKEHRSRTKRIRKTAAVDWTSRKFDKQKFEEIIPKEAMAMGKAENKVTQVLEKIQKHVTL